MHEYDSTADDPAVATGANDTDGDDGGDLSRRAFLKAGVGAGTGALALGAGMAPASARQQDCTSFGTMSVGGGDFQLVNNDWGSSSVDMCIWTDSDGAYGYEWATRSEGGEPNYPQSLVGTKPWGSDTGVADFPVRRGDVTQLEMAVDVDQSISGGEWDLAEEWWLMEQPPSQQTGTHVHEVMMVLDWGGGHGHYMEERNVWTDKYGNTIDYWANYDGGGTAANFHIFRVRGGLTTGKVDLKPVIDYMSQRHGVSDDLWLSGVELGNEYWQGAQGDVTFNQFDVTINGTTYASGGSGSSDWNTSTPTPTPTPTETSTSDGSTDDGQSPHGWAAQTLPGTIQAEDYDDGGPGVAYHDTTSGNAGGAYRSGDVDVQSATEGGYNVGWIADGEWLEYTVDVESSGTYELDARVASNSGGGSFDLAVDGTRMASASFSDTGGWQSWTTVPLGTVDLSSGRHTFRVEATAAGWNLNWIDVTSGSSGGSTETETSTPTETETSTPTETSTSDGTTAGYIAKADPGTTTASVGERITFRVTDTSGSGHWIETLEWSFGDGTSATGWWQTHRYDSAGTYTVELVATDNTGATTTHEVTVTVA